VIKNREKSANQSLGGENRRKRHKGSRRASGERMGTLRKGGTRNRGGEEGSLMPEVPGGA